MIKKTSLLALGALLVMLVLAAPAMAAVTSEAKEYGVDSFRPVLMRLELSSDDLVAGLQAEMNYDPTYFESPRLFVQTGAITFETVTNEVEPGRFRFVMYNDPTAGMTLQAPVAEIQLKAKANLPRDTEFLVTFTDARAARPDGSSYGEDVTLAPFTLRTDEASARNWSLYE